MTLYKSELQLRVDDPSPQRRLTVFFRLLLSIPHFFVLYILYILVSFLTAIGWFAALFTSRNPFHTFNVQVLRWQNRVFAYLYLLTDQYPPFTFEDEPYAVMVSLEDEGLSRLTVLFRGILYFPVSLVAMLVSAGASLVALASWFIVLVTGELPYSLHYGLSATLRFNSRVMAYGLLLQEKYPRGLFGDGTYVGYKAVDSELSESDESGTVAIEFLSNEDQADFHEEPNVEDVESEEIDEDQTYWSLALSKGAKVVISIELALGVATLAMYFVAASILSNSLGGQVSQGGVWNLLYRQDIVTLHASVANASQAELSQSNAASVNEACQQVLVTMNSLKGVPYYPLSGPNVMLVSAVEAAAKGAELCVTYATKTHSMEVLQGSVSDLQLSQREFQTFLNES